MPKKKCKPKLGCATTFQLLNEIKARGEVGAITADLPETTPYIIMVTRADELIERLPDALLQYKTHQDEEEYDGNKH